LTQEVNDGVVHLRLRGELDLATVPLFESKLEGAAEQAIVLDLSELTFIDVAGLQAVIVAETHARTNDQDLTLLDGCRPVRKLFKLTGHEHLLDGHEDGRAHD
jgi:anti-anti-sigma factor